MIGQGANAQAAEKRVIAGYNAKLVTRADAFKTTNTGVSIPGAADQRNGLISPQVKTWLWDSASDFTRILDSPTQFGFSDATSVGNAKSFWGCVHQLQPLICNRGTYRGILLTVRMQRRLPSS